MAHPKYMYKFDLTFNSSQASEENICFPLLLYSFIASHKIPIWSDLIALKSHIYHLGKTSEVNRRCVSLKKGFDAMSFSAKVLLLLALSNESP